MPSKGSGVPSWEKEAVTECWIWSGAYFNHGRGICCLWVDGVRYRLAPRWAYHFHTGQAPGALSVCHTCDNPACVNPEHLYLGTQLRNMQDASARGRLHRAKGTDSPRSKLTVQQVRRAARLRAGGRTLRDLAAGLGVKADTLSHHLRLRQRRPA